MNQPIDLDHVSKAFVGIASPLVGLVTSYQEQIEWHLRAASLLVGLAVGISSGANFLGALLAQDMLGQAATVVTIFCDDNKKYLSTALMQEEPRKAEFLSPAVELLGFSCLPRAFARGWDPFPH